MTDTLTYLPISRTEGLIGCAVAFTNDDGSPVDCTDNALEFSLRSAPGQGAALLDLSIGAGTDAGSSLVWLDRAGGIASPTISPLDIADQSKFPRGRGPTYQAFLWGGLRLTVEATGIPVFSGQFTFRVAIQEEVVIPQ